MQFPRFAIRDMVESQRRLLVEHLGIDHVVAVVGPSMGGMQVLQWGVSHPDFMDSWSPWCRWPGRRPGRGGAGGEPEGDHARPGLEGRQLRPRRPRTASGLWRDILNFLAARTPDMYRAQFADGQLDVLPWLKQQEDAR